MEEKSVRFVMRVSPEFMRMVDDWRRLQGEIPSRSDAVRKLSILGMTHSLEEGPIYDLLSLVARMYANGHIPPDYTSELGDIFDKLEKTGGLREAMLESLEGLRNLPPEEPLPAKATKRPKK